MLHYLELPGWVPDDVVTELIRFFSEQARKELKTMVWTHKNATTPTLLHKHSVSQESALAVRTSSEGSHQLPYRLPNTGQLEYVSAGFGSAVPQ